MSYYFRTIPKNIALILKEKYLLDIFVETGTYVGETSEWAASHFLQVHTIEQLQDYYLTAESRLAVYPNISVYLNDSRNVLPEIMYNMGDYGTLFYLDAHWSEGAQYGRPLIDSVAVDEILLINQWNNKNHAIVLDDAHRFGTAKWPTAESVIRVLENNGQRSVRILLDTFVATPNNSFYMKRNYIDTYANINAPAIDFIALGRIRN